MVALVEQEQFETFGNVAIELRCGWHHLDRLAKKRAFPFKRAGRVRLIDRSDLATIRAALVSAGYVKEEAGHGGR